MSEIAVIIPLGKAYNPDEARKPAGEPGGGEWTKGQETTEKLRSIFNGTYREAVKYLSDNDYYAPDVKRHTDESDKLVMYRAAAATSDPKLAEQLSNAWIRTTSEQNLVAALIQPAAEEAFASGGDPWRHPVAAANREKLERAMAGEAVPGYQPLPAREGFVPPPAPALPTGERVAENLREMHANTQAWFEEHGISEVTLYRGVSIPENHPAVKAGAGASIHLDGQPLNAFTISQKKAGVYALRPGGPNQTTEDISGHVGLVLEATVPVRYIVSHALTGMGLFPEREMVVMNNPVPFTVKEVLHAEE